MFPVIVEPEVFTIVDNVVPVTVAVLIVVLGSVPEPELLDETGLYISVPWVRPDAVEIAFVAKLFSTVEPVIELTIVE
ncbi:hypothetical protein OfM1_12660 [Lactovum odontotermitis]